MNCGRCGAEVFDDDGALVHGQFVGRACIEGIVTPPPLPLHADRLDDVH